MISRRIIIPLIIVIIFSGIAGVLTAKKRMEAQLREAREAAESIETLK